MWGGISLIQPPPIMAPVGARCIWAAARGEGRPASPIAAAAGGPESPAPAPSCHGGGWAAPRRPGPGAAPRPPARLAGRAAAPVPPQGLAPPQARVAEQTKGGEAGAADREESGG